MCKVVVPLQPPPVSKAQKTQTLVTLDFKFGIELPFGSALHLLLAEQTFQTR